MLTAPSFLSARSGAHRGRHWLAGLALVLAASFAWALPTPKDIEQAVNAGEYRQAETLLREVLKEKPNSAKAHYELGEVLAREGRNGDARQALLEAQRLDPSLKFASDPQRFRTLLDKIPLSDNKPALSSPASSNASAGAPLNTPAATPAPVSKSPASAPASGGGFPWFYLVIAGGVLFVVWKIASRVLTPPAPAMAGAGVGAGAGAAMGGNGFGRAPTAPGYGQPPVYGQPGYGQPGYGAPASSGPGIGGVVLGGLAGAAAGYGLAKVLEHGDDRSSGSSGSGSNSGSGHSVNDTSGGYTPIDNPPDYGAFDAGSGSSDSWDSGGDAGGSDDNNW